MMTPSCTSTHPTGGFGRHAGRAFRPSASAARIKYSRIWSTLCTLCGGGLTIPMRGALVRQPSSACCLAFETLTAIKLQQLVWHEPAHRLSARDQCPQPMPGREEGLGLFHSYPLIRAMLVTPLHAHCAVDGAAIVHTDHFILGECGAAVEVCRPKDKFNVHFQTKLFECFPPYRLLKALTLLKATGDTLPLPSSDVLGCK